jgi:glucose/arabinose dehydrogenase
VKALLLATVMLAVSCSGASSTGPAAAGSSSSSSSSSLVSCVVGPQTPPLRTIAATFPTALAFAPDGRLFFAQRSGAVRVWQAGAVRLFAKVNASQSGERGLLGLAISPTFAIDRFVYAFYSDADGTHQEVVRWTDCGGTGTNITTLVRLPAGSDCCHKGGRLAFGPDGKLYVTLGEEHVARVASNTTDVRGKVLRYNPDGSVPADNPFGQSNPVWAAGFRNPFGIAFSSSGAMAVTNNGPTGDAGSPSTGYDTVIESVQRGGIYQWPTCYGYGHVIASGGSCSGIAPDWSSESNTVVPTGAAFVDDAGPSGYAGHLVFCTLGVGMLVLTPAGGRLHASVESGPPDCRLDVKQGPDHALYYADTGHIYRLG